MNVLIKNQNTIINENEADEADELTNIIQNRINDIQSEITEFISSSVETTSPKPITPLESKIAALEGLVNPPIESNDDPLEVTEKHATYMYISDDEGMMLLDLDEIPSPPLPSYLALNRTPSPSPLPETFAPLPRRSFSPLPQFVPSPSRPLTTEVRPPTFRDIFNQNHELRKQSVVNMGLSLM